MPISGVLKDIQDYFQINDSMSGLLQTVFICSYMIFAPIFGYLGDRYSRRMIMSVGIFIWSGAVLASSVVERHVSIDLSHLPYAYNGVGWHR